MERGGGCERCGYCRCIRALQFHHVDPSHKGDYPTKGHVSLRELTDFPGRFLLLCANCHFEEHEAQDQASKNRIPCETCGTIFVSPRYLAQMDRGKYCSKPCLHQANRKRAASQESVIPRFWKYAVPGEGDACWGWTGYASGHADRRQRYPMIPTRAVDGSGRNVLRIAAHVSYEIHNGPLPPGTQLLRTCRNDGCVNPAHLKRRKAS